MEIPLKICIITTSGRVKKYFSGIVVYGHARMHRRNNGPLTDNMDLLLNLSDSLPQIRKKVMFVSWLNTDSPTTRERL
jgi:transcriptional regulator of met regulon